MQKFCRRRNSLFLVLSGMAWMVSMTGFWLGTLVHMNEHQSMYGLPKISTTTGSIQQVYENMHNRTVASIIACNETLDRAQQQQARRGALEQFGFVTMPSFQNKCDYPPHSMSCEADYSILVTSQATNLRRLFLNLLQYATHDVPVDVIMVNVSQTVLKDNVMYGHRILAWHKNSQITLHWGDTLWDGLSQLRTNDVAGILWMDGDTLFPGNRRGLEVGFNVWKRYSDSLVVARAWPIHLSAKHDVLLNTTRDMAIICKDDSLVIGDNNSSPLRLADLSGMWMHSNLLCLLQSCPFTRLAKRLNRARLAASVWLMQLAQAPLHVYPARVEEVLSNNQSQESKPETSLERKSASWIDKTLLTRMAGFYGTMPMETIEWCTASGITRPCETSASGIPEEAISELDACFRTLANPKI